jgi:glycosyltransferase involved in cell wall biosynthesis
VTTVPITLKAFLQPFARHFRARGWRVDAMAQGVTGCPECALVFDQVHEVRWSRNPLDVNNFFAAPRQIREAVVNTGYDLVHVHTPIAAFVTRFALRGLRQTGRPRVIYTAHGFHFYRGGPRLKGTLFRTCEKLAGAWTDYLVVINREDEEAARQYGIVPPDRIRYMPGIGVDMTVYGPENATEADVVRVRAELGLSPSDRIILIVAELIARKRHRDALQAFALLNRPNVVLACAGDGPLSGPLKQMAQQLGVGDRVRFLGHRRDIPALLRTAAVMLLPSEQEGLPRSVMESLCLGTPVIGSRIRGMTDLLDDGCGLLFGVGDTKGMAEAMAWVLDHPEEAQETAQRGKAKMTRYDIGQILRLHESLYEEALQKVDGVARVLPELQAAHLAGAKEEQPSRL